MNKMLSACLFLLLASLSTAAQNNASSGSTATAGAVQNIGTLSAAPLKQCASSDRPTKSWFDRRNPLTAPLERKWKVSSGCQDGCLPRCYSQFDTCNNSCNGDEACQTGCQDRLSNCECGCCNILC